MFWRFGSVDAQPPRGGDRLVEGGVDAAGLRVDELGQRIDVGRLELLHAAVLEDLRAAARGAGRSSSSTSSAVEEARVLAVFFADFMPELVEEDVAQLDGRVDVEGPAGQRVDLAR